MARRLADTVAPAQGPVTGGPCGVAQIGYWWSNNTNGALAVSACGAGAWGSEGTRHAAARAESAKAGNGNGIRGAGARGGTAAPGQGRHQSRHRPAGFPDAAAHR